MTLSRFDRREFMALMGVGGMAALGLAPERVAAQALRRVNYMFAFPQLSTIVANQTSIPRQYGLFAQEGLEVEHNVSSGGASVALQLVSSGNQDIGSGGMAAALQRAAAGEDMGLVFFYNQIRKNNTVVAVLPDSPIQTLADLAGKSVGVTALGSGPEAVLRHALREIDVNPDSDVEFVTVGIAGQALQAIRAGEVDAYCVAVGSIAPMEAMGASFRFLPMPEWVNEVIGPGLFTNRRFMDGNRDVCVAIGRTVARASVFMIENPEAAVRIHWALYPEEVPQGAPFEEALQRTLAAMRRQTVLLSFAETDTVRKFGYMDPAAIARQLQIEGVEQLADRTDDFFTNALVDEMNDFDIDEMVQLARSFTP